LLRGRKLWLAIQLVFAAAVIWFAARSLSGQWAEVGERLRGLHVDWGLISAASALMLLSYFILIEAWRELLAAWSARLSRVDAARVWLVSNLGKYVPGKVWSIIAMGAMARERGASAIAAGGSSVVMQVMSVITGLAVAAVFGATSRGMMWGAAAGIVLLVLAVLTAPVVMPRALAALGVITGRSLGTPIVPRQAVWVAAVTTTVAWLITGLAFRYFCAALGVAVQGIGPFIAVYAASYVAGFVALFAPGGIGVREGALVATMQQSGLASAPEAAVIAVASRIWLTILEILPGLLALALPRAVGRGAE
jgi:hypothetical protein